MNSISNETFFHNMYTDGTHSLSLCECLCLYSVPCSRRKDEDEEGIVHISTLVMRIISIFINIQTDSFLPAFPTNVLYIRHICYIWSVQTWIQSRSYEGAMKRSVLWSWIFRNEIIICYRQWWSSNTRIHS